jgi:hypothetical protein
MNFNSKKVCFSFLLYIAGTCAEVESNLGFYGLVLRNKLQAKINELTHKYSVVNQYDETTCEEKMSFLRKIKEKIDQFTTQKDLQAKKEQEWKNLSSEARFFTLPNNKNPCINILSEGKKINLQIDYTFQCLESLNNEYLLRSLENSSVLVDEILNCMNAAEEMTQK